MEKWRDGDNKRKTEPYKEKTCNAEQNKANMEGFEQYSTMGLLTLKHYLHSDFCTLQTIEWMHVEFTKSMEAHKKCVNLRYWRRRTNFGSQASCWPLVLSVGVMIYFRVNNHFLWSWILFKLCFFVSFFYFVGVDRYV